MFYFLYVLRSKKDGMLYIGCAKDWVKRLKLHNNGKVKATRNRKPFEIIYFEAFIDRLDAYQREKYFKTGWGRKHLRKTLKNPLK